MDKTEKMKKKRRRSEESDGERESRKARKKETREVEVEEGVHGAADTNADMNNRENQDHPKKKEKKMKKKGKRDDVDVDGYGNKDDKKKKKKERKKQKNDKDDAVDANSMDKSGTDDTEAANSSENVDYSRKESKERKKMKGKQNVDLEDAAAQEIRVENSGNGSGEIGERKKQKRDDVDVDGHGNKDDKKKKRKKQKSDKDNVGGTNSMDRSGTDDMEPANISENVDHLRKERKERKEMKGKQNADLEDAAAQEIRVENSGNGSGEIGKRKKQKRDDVDVDGHGNKDDKKKRKKQESYKDDAGSANSMDRSGTDDTEPANISENVDHSRKKRKERKKMKGKQNADLEDAAAQEIRVENSGNGSGEIGERKKKRSSSKSKKGDSKAEDHSFSEAEDGNKDKKKKKTKKARSGKKGLEEVGSESGVEKTTVQSERSASKRTSKRVSFSDDLEVFPSPQPSGEERKLVQGKRFTPEEDVLVRKAVIEYLAARGLGEEAIDMVLHCSKHPEVRHCWKEIAAALPHRPVESIYYRAHVLFERSETRSWTPEEYELVRDFHKKHGSDWKTLADALGKHRIHVKDTWRRIKFPMKRGHWTQDEYQNLYDLVNKDLRLRADAEKRTKYGMLRDNISWTAISEKLETRTDASCCVKWYNQLTSRMVAEGDWLDTDDYHLLIALKNLEAFCMEDVDWDCLLEHRSGDICRKRWNEMVRHLGEHAKKPFADQVEVLYGRYCPDVLEARETYDSKPAVD